MGKGSVKGGSETYSYFHNCAIADVLVALWHSRYTQWVRIGSAQSVAGAESGVVEGGVGMFVR